MAQEPPPQVHPFRHPAREPEKHPLDRKHELRVYGWSYKQLITEARQHGWYITKRELRSWVNKGWLPPPREEPDANLRKGD